MSLEDKLSGWTGPSSTTEQEKQERTERMIREAVKEYPAFDGVDLDIYAKGSYANNTNVKADSDWTAPAILEARSLGCLTRS